MRGADGKGEHGEALADGVDDAAQARWGCLGVGVGGLRDERLRHLVLEDFGHGFGGSFGVW